MTLEENGMQEPRASTYENVEKEFASDSQEGTASTVDCLRGGCFFEEGSNRNVLPGLAHVCALSHGKAARVSFAVTLPFPAARCSSEDRKPLVASSAIGSVSNS